MVCLKYLIIVSILISFSPVFARGNIFDEMSSMEKDKYIHFSAGVIISHGTYPIFRLILPKDKKVWLYSFSAAVLVSLGKEIYDIKDTGFNGEDLLAGALGGITIVVVKF